MLLWVSLFLDYTDVRSGNGGKIIVLPRPTTKGRADAAQQRPGQQRGGGGRPPAGALSAVA